jgi:hypothetical protein
LKTLVEYFGICSIEDLEEKDEYLGIPTNEDTEDLEDMGGM